MIDDPIEMAVNCWHTVPYASAGMEASAGTQASITSSKSAGIFKQPEILVS